MSAMSSFADFDGVNTHPTMVHPCAKCMFGCMSCGTIIMCPTSAGGKLVMDGDKATLEGNYFCFCLKPSPIPCCMGCGACRHPNARVPSGLSNDMGCG